MPGMSVKRFFRYTRLTKPEAIHNNTPPTRGVWMFCCLGVRELSIERIAGVKDVQILAARNSAVCLCICFRL